MMDRTDVYKLIDEERNYQDKKWNFKSPPSNGTHSWEDWFVYIEDYVNEAKHILSRNPKMEGDKFAAHSMRKVAAMAVCAMEQNGGLSR